MGKKSLLLAPLLVFLAACHSTAPRQDTPKTPSVTIQQQQFEPNPVGNGETTTQPVAEQETANNQQLSQPSEESSPVQSLW